MDRAIVVGTDVDALLSARALIANGYRVVVLQTADTQSRFTTWNDSEVDVGPQLLSTSGDRGKLLADLTSGEIVTVAPRRASYFNGRLTPGIDEPDLYRPDTDVIASAQSALLEAAVDRHDVTDANASLLTYLQERFGGPAAKALAAAIEAKSCAPLSRLSAAAAVSMPVQRIKLFSEAATQMLRHVAELGELLAGHERTSADDHYAYPSTGGISGFFSRARARLRDMGVVFREAVDIERLGPSSITLASGEDMSADLIVWTTGIQSLAAAAAIADFPTTPFHERRSLLTYFETPTDAAAEWNWINVFDPGLQLVRVSQPPAHYRSPNGATYICCETPQSRKRKASSEQCAQSTWREVCALGYADGPLPQRWTIRPAPLVERYPTLDYARAQEMVDDALTRMPNVVLAENIVQNPAQMMRMLSRREGTVA